MATTVSQHRNRSARTLYELGISSSFVVVLAFIRFVGDSFPVTIEENSLVFAAFCWGCFSTLDFLPAMACRQEMSSMMVASFGRLSILYAWWQGDECSIDVSKHMSILSHSVHMYIYIYIYIKKQYIYMERYIYIYIFMHIYVMYTHIHVSY